MCVTEAIEPLGSLTCVDMISNGGKKRWTTDQVKQYAQKKKEKNEYSGLRAERLER